MSFTGWLSISLFLHLLPVVSADTYNLGGLVAASVVAFVLLVVIIAMLILGTLWNDWYPAVQRARGKVKVPRDFWKKKEDTRMRLLAGSSAGSVIALSETGAPPTAVNRARDTDAPKASWVSGWNSTHTAGPRSSTYAAGPRVYEEKGATLELEEEPGDDFQIETTVVDNETLDLGPYHDIDPLRHVSPAAAVTIDHQPQDEAVYSVVTRGSSRRQVDPTRQDGGDEAADKHPSRPASGASLKSEGLTSFANRDRTLVAL